MRKGHFMSEKIINNSLLRCNWFLNKLKNLAEKDHLVLLRLENLWLWSEGKLRKWHLVIWRPFRNIREVHTKFSASVWFEAFSTIKEMWCLYTSIHKVLGYKDVLGTVVKVIDSVRNGRSSVFQKDSALHNKA